MTKRIAVLASGGGSNLEAIFEHLARRGADAAAGVVLVGSDRREGKALERARTRGVATAVVDPRDDGSLSAALAEHRPDLIALAGYLRLVPPPVVREYRGRIVNIHPALLPAFGGPGMYGQRVHEAVLRAGAKLTGVTVHFVDEIYDRGPIIAQWPVPVREGDTAADLAARVLRIEHRLYPRIVESVAAGCIVLERDGRVRGGWCVEDAAVFTLAAAAGLERSLAAVVPP